MDRMTDTPKWDRETGYPTQTEGEAIHAGQGDRIARTDREETHQHGQRDKLSNTDIDYKKPYSKTE